jgi:hypothetical protein
MPKPRPPFISKLQDSDFIDAEPLKEGTIVLLTMEEGYTSLNDIKRIGFVSDTSDNDKYDVIYKYIIGVGPDATLKKINANRSQILNLHLQQNVDINIHNTKDKIIKVLDSVLNNHKYLTNSESQDDLYQNFLRELKRLHNPSREISTQERVTGSYFNDGKFPEHHGGRSRRRRKSRHHKKTNRRRKSNRRKRSKLNIKSKH